MLWTCRSGIALAVTFLAVGCGGGGGAGPQYRIGGTVSGLEGTGLVLRNNGGDDLTIDANGSFAFATRTGQGGSYAVTVRTAPTADIPTGVIACAVASGVGTIESADVTDVAITCTTTAFFIGTDSTHGDQLWKTDGTDAGTMRVTDVTTDAGSRRFSELTGMGGAVYYSVNAGGPNDFELWRSDGTPGGTRMVKNINDALEGEGSYPQGLAVMDGILYFAATTVDYGLELWRSDGTEDGTWMVKDINESYADSGPSSLTVMDGVLYFSAYDGTAGGFQVWRSDGVRDGAGTRKVTSISGISSGSAPSNLFVLDGTLYFVVNDVTNGREIWKYNSADDTTTRVTDIPGSGSYLNGLAAFDGALYFWEERSATSEVTLWKSTGSLETTQLVMTFPGSYEAAPVVFDGALYFAASNEIGYSAVLWKSSGTAETTSVVIDSTDAEIWASNLTVPNGVLYFSGCSDAAAGNEPWISDGTPAPPRMLKDINPSGSSIPRDFTLVNGAVLFSAYDGQTRLWRTDGTSDGTVEMKDATGAPVDFIGLRGSP